MLADRTSPPPSTHHARITVERAILTSTEKPLLKMKSMLAKTGPPAVLFAFACACGESGGSDVDSNGDAGSSDTDDVTGEDTTPDDGDDATSDDPTSDDVTSSDTDAVDESSSADSGSGATLPVDLGAAGDFAILAKSGISVVPPSAVTGDLGLSPAAATFITGFSLTADPTNVFSTSTQVTGNVYAADYEPPTPADLTAAISDMELAFTDAAGRAPDETELGAGDIGGMTLEPGVYKWGTGLMIPTDVTLSGSGTDVWIFQIAADLTMSSGAEVMLTGGAVPENVFWQVSGAVDLGTTAHCEGIVLTQTSITLRTGASINGRLMAQTAVDLDGNTVVEPAR